MADKQCDPYKCKRAVVGFTWLRTTAGDWKHQMIRECFQCRRRDAEAIIYVDIVAPVCSTCFKQDIVLESSKAKTVSRCTACGGTDIWHLDPPLPRNAIFDDDALDMDDFEDEDDDDL